MVQKTEYKYPKNWFKHNLKPIPTGFAGGNCSACVFRNNAPKYCEKLACVCYIDSDHIESVYWVARETHANIAMWTELNEFFRTVPKQKIRTISNDIVMKTVLSRERS